ncbi:unnamed protein product [Ixodes pacificus]
MHHCFCSPAFQLDDFTTLLNISVEHYFSSLTIGLLSINFDRFPPNKNVNKKTKNTLKTYKLPGEACKCQKRFEIIACTSLEFVFCHTRFLCIKYFLINTLILAIFTLTSA